MREVAEMWEECLDYDGKPNKNKKKHGEFISKRKRDKKKNKAQLAGKKQKKLKF
jgi:hypothetical protein